MKKILVSIIVSVMLLSMLTGTAFGAETSKIDEVPDIKIIMDGTLAEYENTPISISGRTMLPLRELVVMLGVPNDEDHISYNDNGTDKIVTVKNEELEIVLYIGKNDAYINGSTTTLDVAPVLYNNYTYIPLRFVAEALEKKVVWEGNSRTILISDIEKFNSIMEIMSKANEANAEIERLMLDMLISIETGNDMMKVNIDLDANAAIDKVDKKMYMEMDMSMLGIDMQTKTYFADNTLYSYDSSTNQWQKTTYSQEEYNMLFDSQANANAMELDETLCAGLTQIESENEDEIVLIGDVYMTSLLENAIAQQGSGLGAEAGKMEFKDYSMKMVLDKETYLLKSIDMLVKIEQEVEGQEILMDMDISVSYSNYNGTFEIKVPDDVLENAVEVDATSGNAANF